MNSHANASRQGDPPPLSHEREPLSISDGVLLDREEFQEGIGGVSEPVIATEMIEALIKPIEEDIEWLRRQKSHVRVYEHHLAILSHALLQIKQGDQNEKTPVGKFDDLKRKVWGLMSRLQKLINVERTQLGNGYHLTNDIIEFDSLNYQKGHELMKEEEEVENENPGENKADLMEENEDPSEDEEDPSEDEEDPSEEEEDPSEDEAFEGADD